jgi:hypothetical protein
VQHDTAFMPVILQSQENRRSESEFSRLEMAARTTD